MLRVLVGDARVKLTELLDQSVHCVVTSPPYYGIRDYGVEGQTGQEQTVDEYVAELVAVFREARRVLRDDGALWLNLGDSWATGNGAGRGIKAKDIVGIPWAVAFALRADGWYLRQDVIWAKSSCMPESVRDRCTKSHEYIFLLSKSASYYYDAHAVAEPVTESTKARLSGGTAHQAGSNRVPGKTNGPMRAVGNGETRNRRSVWTLPPGRFKGAHFATFPLDVPDICIRASTSEAGCCGICGKPWARVIQRREDVEGTGAAVGGYPERHDGGQRERDPSGRGGNVLATVRIGTSDFVAACSCASSAVPCVVLDPFGGAGTTALAAKRAGRDAVYIDLNPEYALMAMARVSEG